MAKSRKAVAVSCAAAFLVSLGSAALIAEPAHASMAEWSTALQNVGAETVLTHTDGDISVGQIGGGGVDAVQTVQADGDAATSIAASATPQVSPNTAMWGVGADGTVLALAAQPIGAGVQTYVAAYDGDTRLWYVVPPDTCGGQFEYVQALKVGTDGNVYVVSYRASGCGGQEFFLSALDPADGSTVFRTSLGGSFSVAPTNLFVYDSGVAVLSSSSVLRYYSTSGSLLSETTLSLAGGEWMGWATVTHTGRVYVLINKSHAPTETCPYPWTSVSDRLLAFGPEGDIEDENNAAMHYNVQDCANAYPLATPNGGVVILVRAFGLDDKLIALDANMDALWDTGFDEGTVADRTFAVGASHDMLVDNNGNIVTLTPYTRQSQTSYGVQFGVLSGVTGVRKATVYTDEFDTTLSFNVTTNGVGLAANTLYVTAHVCGSGQCGSSSTFKLYSVKVAGLGMDYPRARVLGLSPAAQTSRKYVALGDSYSSGESVEPFSSSSDSDGCHRSTRAYAELLNQDTALDLDLQAFVACSGATTGLLASGMNGESPQLDALSTDDDIVTITIGGNDAEFKEFAIECFNLTPGAHCNNSLQYSRTMGRIEDDLPGRLANLFDDIAARIGENTRVLVIGYPHLMPTGMDEWPNCIYLSQEERVAVGDVLNGLNGALRQAASNAGSQFEFVDADAVLDGLRLSPFAGHELCSDGAYFNGATYPFGYSYHPNQQGQAAYEQLVRFYLLYGVPYAITAA